ncbi:hypothetical protein [Sulfurospirillum sp. 1612]|uniref:hypothetical protein n=1 Tax=Sulfurospirillum sp. 1612 TaxID=3094835 RepID=UPI002F95A7AC
MNNFENYLENVDKKQRYLIYVMIFGLMIYVFVYIMMPRLDEQKNLENNINQLQTQLRQNAPTKFKNTLALKEKQLLQLRTEKESKQEQINLLVSGLYQLKFALFDDKKWAKNITEILQNSLKRNLQIDYIKSSNVKNQNSKDILQKKKTLEIQGSGNYIDIVAFISYIDTLDTLLQFSKSDIFLKDNRVNFKLDIDLYGIGL